MAAIPIASVLGLGVALVLTGLLWFTRRRVQKTIVCPVDHEGRVVEFTGRTLDKDHWDDVASCGRAGQDPLTGRRLTCAKSCLKDPANCPEMDLATAAHAH